MINKYEIKTTKAYKKARKKLSPKDLALLDEVVKKLAGGEILEAKWQDHPLKGQWQGFRECHIRPDLLLIYQINDLALILTCVELGSHSELFKK